MAHAIFLFAIEVFYMGLPYFGLQRALIHIYDKCSLIIFPSSEPVKMPFLGLKFSLLFTWQVSPHLLDTFSQGDHPWLPYLSRCSHPLNFLMLSSFISFGTLISICNYPCVCLLLAYLPHVTAGSIKRQHPHLFYLPVHTQNFTKCLARPRCSTFVRKQRILTTNLGDGYFYKGRN